LLGRKIFWNLFDISIPVLIRKMGKTENVPCKALMDVVGCIRITKRKRK
jgi:hypothetical protein